MLIPKTNREKFQKLLSNRQWQKLSLDILLSLLMKKRISSSNGKKLKKNPTTMEQFIAIHPMNTRSMDNVKHSTVHHDTSDNDSARSSASNISVSSSNSSQSSKASNSASSASTRSSGRRKTPWKRNPISITIESPANDFKTSINHYESADDLISTGQTLIGDTGSSIHVLKDQIDSGDKTSRTNIKLGFANGQTMKAASLAVNDKLGKYVIAPASTENIISIQSLLEMGYNLSGNKTHLFIHPPHIKEISFARIRPEQISLAFLKHTDGIYRVSMDDLKTSLHLN